MSENDVTERQRDAPHLLAAKPKKIPRRHASEDKKLTMTPEQQEAAIRELDKELRGLMTKVKRQRDQIMLPPELVDYTMTFALAGRREEVAALREEVAALREQNQRLDGLEETHRRHLYDTGYDFCVPCGEWMYGKDEDDCPNCDGKLCRFCQRCMNTGFSDGCPDSPPHSTSSDSD